MNILKGFKFLNPIYQMFFISTLISCFFTIYLVAHLEIETLYSVMVSSVTLIMMIIYLTKFAAYPFKWKKGEIFLLILTFITVFHLPSHFVSAGRISYRREKKDDLLIKIDKYILGWLVKEGKISAWIDNNDYIGPHTYFGQFINNSLQIFYFFYYLIPYVSMHFMSLLNCLREIIFRFKHDGFKSTSHKKNWNTTLFVFGVYLLTCVFVFFVNTLVPATSPRKYLKDEFTHPLKLSGFGKFLNKKCKDERSANSFPSGHVAEILSIGLAYNAAKNKIAGQLIIFFSVLIAISTLFLRYHYFCDIIMAVFLAFLSFGINYFFGLKRYRKYNKEHERISKILNDSPDTMI
jgi:membrane-associated phospholipid phosphatase